MWLRDQEKLYVSHMTTEKSHSLFTTHIVHHSHSCVPHKGQISSLKEFQVCCRHKIQCSSSYSYSIVIYKLHSSMHLNTGGQWLTRFEIQRKNKNSTTVQIKTYDRHTDTSFIVYILPTVKERPLFALNVLNPLKLRGTYAVLTAPPMSPLLLMNLLKEGVIKLSTVFDILHTVNW